MAASGDQRDRRELPPARTSWAPASARSEAALAEIGEPTELVVVDNALRRSTPASVVARGRARRPAPRDAREPRVSDRGEQGRPGFQRRLGPADQQRRGGRARRGRCTCSRPAARTLTSAPWPPRCASRTDRGTINSAGIGVDRLGIAFDRLLGEPVAASETEPVEVFGACGGAALYRREMLDEIGGFDESFFFALDDADVAWRAQMRGLALPLRARARSCTTTTAPRSGTARASSTSTWGSTGSAPWPRTPTRGLLRRHGLAMIGYDIAYVAFAGRDRPDARAAARTAAGAPRVALLPARRRAAPAARAGPREGLQGGAGRRAAWLGNTAAHRPAREPWPDALS